MSAAARLIEAGIHLEAHGDRLDVWSPTPLTDEQRQWIRQNKPRLLRELTLDANGIFRLSASGRIPDDLIRCEWCQNERHGVCGVDGIGVWSRPVRCKDFISRLSMNELIEQVRKH